MAKKDGIATLSREDADAARALAAKKKADHAEKERVRYMERKNAKVALEKAGLDPAEVDLTIEQRKRAAASLTEKAGLKGKALAAWILEAKTTADTVREARASGPRKPRASGDRAPRTPKDPEAAEFAAACKGMADLKSKFPSSQARVFLDKVGQRLDGSEIVAWRIDDVAKDEHRFGVVALRQFAIHGTADPEIRKALTALGHDEKALWGRKLGLFLLHRYGQREA